MDGWEEEEILYQVTHQSNTELQRPPHYKTHITLSVNLIYSDLSVSLVCGKV